MTFEVADRNPAAVPLGSIEIGQAFTPCSIEGEIAIKLYDNQYTYITGPQAGIIFDELSGYRSTYNVIPLSVELTIR